MNKHREAEDDAGPPLDRRTALGVVGSGLFAAGSGGLGGLGVGTASAQERFPPEERTRWGRPRRVGDGSMAAFLTEGRSGVPRYLGVWFTSDALDGLVGGEASPGPPTELPLPAAARDATLVRWVTADWGPPGRILTAVSDAPRIAFRFYLLARVTVRREIRPGECDVDEDGRPEASVPCDVLERGTEPLAPLQQPPGYAPTDDIVPLVGNQWVNERAPEFRGEPFTHTWVYGSFDGGITSLEPTVALEYLDDLRGREVTDIATPDAFPRPGFYPTQYVIRYLRRQDAYAVFLRRFRLFDGA
jgi:hypothetical protein